jgi:RHS repeat-associated protein
VAWARRFDYDRWGNRTAVWNGVSGGSLIQSAVVQMQAGVPTNRMESVNGVSCLYDAAGNLKNDTASYQYDAENRLTSYNQGAGLYSYDGEGRRVKRQDSSGTTVYVYNAIDQLVAEYGGAGPVNNGTSYIAQDHLGSTRLVMKGDGSVSRHDYLLFGEEISGTTGARSGIAGYNAADSVKQRFTGYERDESGLDFAQARYYSSAQGRFTSVDPENAGADRSDPQSFNAYSYTRNNPIIYVDPDGMRFRLTDTDGASATFSDEHIFNTLGRNKNIRMVAGRIYLNNVLIGYYDRLSFDDFSLMGNLFYQGMSQRRRASLQAIGAFAVLSANGYAIGQMAGPMLLNSAAATLYLLSESKQQAAVGQVNTNSETRNGAFRAAKRANDIPVTKRPDRVITNPNSAEWKTLNLRRGENIRLYEFTNNRGEKIWIREDGARVYRTGPPQGNHFNSGPAGVENNLKNHHFWRRR